MIIDIHTHVFPDRISGKTIQILEEKGHIKASTDGTLNGLKKSMKEGNIDRSVVLPVVTKLSQFETINNYAAQINGKDGIISFGGIHPDSENYKEELETIRKLGLPGIKLHPEYQETYVDDPKMVRIIRYAAKLGLIVLIHAGLDPGYPGFDHCPPDRAANMLNRIEQPDAKIILAHTGGLYEWDEVEKNLVGKNVWFDTSFSLGRIPDEQFTRIVKNHGADRILFGSDSPWGNERETYEYLMKLDFTKEELERILYKNALELLGESISENVIERRN